MKVEMKYRRKEEVEIEGILTKCEKGSVGGNVRI